MIGDSNETDRVPSDNDDVRMDDGAGIYKRAEFEKMVFEGRAAHKRRSWMLAGSSIVAGGALIAIISALEGSLSRNMHLAAATALFFGYLLLMGAILMSTRVAAMRSRLFCPYCDTPLDLLAEHVALDSGECNSCNKQIVS